MADLRTVKRKFKEFFRTKTASPEGIEFLKKFILPFVRELPQRALGVDDVLNAFFGLDDRFFFYVRATRDFKMVGGYLIRANKPSRTTERIRIKKGQVMILVIDRRDDVARIEVVDQGKDKNYLLERYEFEVIADYLEVIGDESRGFGLRDNRTKPMERRNPNHRIVRRSKLQPTDDGTEL